MKIRRQRLDRIAAALPRVETTLERLDMVNVLSTQLSGDPLGRRFIRADTIHHDRMPKQFLIELLWRVEIEGPRAGNPIRFLRPYFRRPRIERVLNEDRPSLLPMDVETWAFPNRNTCVTISDMSLRNVPFRSYHHHGSSPLRRGSLCLIAAKPGTHCVPRSCENDQGAYGAFFYFITLWSSVMTMIRGTRFIVGEEAAQARALENRFRSYLH